MWRRLRRTTMAPRRPVVFPEQWPLLAVTLLVLLGSILLLVAVLAGWL